MTTAWHRPHRIVCGSTSTKAQGLSSHGIGRHRSRALDGMQAPAVQVEVHLANGLPSFTLVGLAETEVKEARERVRAALLHSGLGFPFNKRITVNLAPADLPKESGRFDLPIAIGILAASGELDPARLEGVEFAGELSLAGELRPVRGALALALAVSREGARRTLVLPKDSAAEAALVQGADVRAAAAPERGGRGAAAAARPLSALPRLAARGGAPLRAARGVARPARRARPGRRQTRARDRRRRRPQPADDRPAGRRQVDAGAAACRHPAADGRRRSAGERGRREPVERRLRARALAPAAVARAAPHREFGRRWSAAAHRRGRARSRWRTAACCSSTSCPNSRATRSRRCASRWRSGQRQHRARRAQRGVPGALPARRGDEPLPLRLARLGGRGAGVPLHARRGGALPGAHLGAAARPHRPARRRAGGARRRDAAGAGASACAHRHLGDRRRARAPGARARS